MLRYLILTFFSCLILLNCDNDFVRSNPYDSSYDGELWMPEKMEITEQNIHTAVLSWIQNEDQIDGFKIDKKQGNMDWVIGYSILDHSASSFVDSNIVPRQPTQYRLYAYADQNESESIIKDVILAFPPPTDLQITSQNLSAVTLDWKENINGEEGFIIGKKVGENELVANYDIVDENITSYTDKDIIPGVPVSYVVRAFYQTTVSDIVTVSTNVTLNAPENLRIEQLFDDEIRLFWDDSNIGEDGFIVEMKYNDGEFNEIVRLDPNTTELILSNIEKNVQFAFRVAAYKSDFISDYSNEESIYIEEVIEGPLVYYPFNGTADDEGNNNGNNGVVRGAELDNDRFDNPDESYYFDGVNDYIDFGVLNTDELSISIWVRLEEYKNNRPCVISKNSAANSDGSYILELSEFNENARFFMKNNDQVIQLESTSQIYPNLWHHIVVTFNGAEIIMYLDGEMEDVKNTGFNKIDDLQDRLVIGKNGIDDFHFCGNIDDIRIFNYAIDNIEVKNLYHENGWEGNNPQDENMELIVGGLFQMGDIWGDGYANENPVHDVTLNGFYISKYEITLNEFLLFLNDIEIEDDGKYHGNLLIETSAATPIQFDGSDYIFVNNAGAVSPDCPIVFCTWYGAVEYCNWISEKNGYTQAYTVNQGSVVCNWNANGYRLPTEAEWEYAARAGGDTTNKWSGTEYQVQAKYYMWFTDNSEDFIHPVGTRKGNSLGLFDMSGNVWEWCWDWYGGYISDAQINPTGVLSGSARVVRGGSYSNKIFACRTIARGTGLPGRGYMNIGFRICRNE